MCATTDRQIRERLDRIPQPANKSKTLAANTPKSPPNKGFSNKYKEAAGNKDADKSSSAESRPALKCYNCQKPGHMARNCPEPMTEKRKQHLVNLVKELQAAEEAESSGNESV